jgi:hypothetical protein
MLTQLKATLSANQSSAAVSMPETNVDSTVDRSSASAALRQFINTAVVAKAAADAPASDDSQAAAGSRQALSAFVGSPLGTLPRIVPGADSQSSGTHAAMATLLRAASSSSAPDSVASQAPAESPQAAPDTTSVPSSVGKCVCGANVTPGNNPIAPPVAIINTPDSSPAVTNNESAAGGVKTANAVPFAWLKHTLTVESALQMGDLHFAESVLNLLTEISGAMEPDLSTRLHLESQSARIRIQRKQYDEAESQLSVALKSLEGAAQKRSAGAAYCMLALAHVYSCQKKTEKAQNAQRVAIAVAQECFGANDPQVTLFKQQLPG